MIERFRRINLHTRQPLGLSPPGIGPSVENPVFRRDASVCKAHWHPGANGGFDDRLLAARKDIQLQAWSAARR